MHLVRVRVAPHTFDLPIVESMIELSTAIGAPLALVGEWPPFDLGAVLLPDGSTVGERLHGVWSAEGVEGYGHRLRHVERWLAAVALLGPQAPWLDEQPSRERGAETAA